MPPRASRRRQYVHCKAVTGEGARRFAVAPAADDAHFAALLTACRQCSARHRVPVRSGRARSGCRGESRVAVGRLTHSKAIPKLFRSTENKDPVMQAQPLDVVTYGEAMTMFVAAETGDLAKVGQFTKRVAGADLNVAIGLSRLGFKVGWMSRVGAIRSGAMCSTCWRRRHRRELRDDRRALSDRFPAQVEERRRQRSRGRIFPQRVGGEPSVARRLRRRLRDRRAPPASDGRRARDFGELARTRVPMAREMRAAGKTISFDPNLRPTLWPSREAMAECAQRTRRARRLGAARHRRRAHADRLHASRRTSPASTWSRARSGVIVKLGAHGAYFRTADGDAGIVPAIPVAKVVDTVGAGDGFAVGVVSALLEGRTCGTRWSAATGSAPRDPGDRRQRRAADARRTECIGSTRHSSHSSVQKTAKTALNLA